MNQNSCYVPDRLLPAYTDQHGKHGILGQATEICLRCHRAVPPNSAPEFAHLEDAAARKAGRYAVSGLVRPKEEWALTLFAVQQNILFSNETFKRRWLEQGQLGGAENDIYYDGKGKWIKRNNMSFHSTYLEFCYRLALHNHFFPSCSVHLTGFLRVDGVLHPVFTQGDVVADRGATRQEVNDALSGLGFFSAGDCDDYYNDRIGIRIEDLHDENVLVSEHGLEVVDPVLYLDERSKASRLAALGQAGGLSAMGPRRGIPQKS